jgi:hypothetical protein
LLTAARGRLVKQSGAIRAFFLRGAAVEHLLEIAHRTAAADEAHPRAIGRVTKSLHDVMTEKIGKQDDDLDPGGNRGAAAALVNAIASADVGGDADAELPQHIGDIAQAISAHEKGVGRRDWRGWNGRRGSRGHCVHDSINEWRADDVADKPVP